MSPPPGAAIPPSFSSSWCKISSSHYRHHTNNNKSPNTTPTTRHIFQMKLLVLILLILGFILPRFASVESQRLVSNSPSTVEKSLIHIIPHSHNDPGWKLSYEQYSKKTHRIIMQVYDKVLQQQQRRMGTDSSAFTSTSTSMNPSLQHFKQFQSKRRHFLWNDIAFLDNLPATHSNTLDLSKFDILDGSYVQWDEALVPVWMQLNVARLGHEMLKGRSMRFIKERYGGSGAHGDNEREDSHASNPSDNNNPTLTTTALYKKYHSKIVETKIGWHVDAFGMSRVTPYVYRGMGIKHVILNRFHSRLRNEMRASRSMEFYWNGLWVHTLYNHYNSPHYFDYDFYPMLNRNDAAAVEKYAKIIVEHARRFQTGYLAHGHVAFIWGDDMRFHFNPHQHFESMDALIDYINNHSDELGYLAQYSNMTHFVDCVTKSVEASHLSEGGVFDSAHSHSEAPLPYEDILHRKPPTQPMQFPQKNDDGDFFPYLDSYPFDYWTGYYSLRPDVKAFTARMEYMLRSAELILSLDSLTNGYNALSSREKRTQLRTAQRKVGLLEHHDGITGTHTNSVNVAYLKDVGYAEQVLEQLMIDSVKRMASGGGESIGGSSSHSWRYLYPISHRHRDPEEELQHYRRSLISFPTATTTQEQQQLILFNPLSWNRKETVFFLSNEENILVRDEKGNRIKTQSLALLSNKGRPVPGIFRVFISVDIEPFGMQTFTLSRGGDERASTKHCPNRNTLHSGASTLHFEDDITARPLAFENHETNQQYAILVDALRYISINQPVLGSGPYIFRVDWGLWMLVGFAIGYAASIILSSVLYIAAFLFTLIFKCGNPLYRLNVYVVSHWRFWTCMVISVGCIMGVSFVHFIYNTASDAVQAYILHNVYNFGIPVSLIVGFVISMCGGLRSWLLFGICFLTSYFCVYMSHPWMNARSYFSPSTVGNIVNSEVHPETLCFEGELVSEHSTYWPLSSRGKDEFLLFQYRLYNNRPNHIELQVSSFAEYNTDLVVRMTHRDSKVHSKDDGFFTDSNQMGSVHRLWKYIDVFQGNYYPVVSKIALQDEGSGDISSVVTSHAVGGTVHQGRTFELMVNRLVGQDDQRGLEYLPIDLYNADIQLWWNLNDSTVEPRRDTWNMRHPIVMFAGGEIDDGIRGDAAATASFPLPDITKLASLLAQTNSHILTLQPIGLELDEEIATMESVPGSGHDQDGIPFMMRLQNFDASTHYTAHQMESILQTHCKWNVAHVTETTFTNINRENYDSELSKEIQTFVFALGVE